MYSCSEVSCRGLPNKISYTSAELDSDLILRERASGRSLLPEKCHNAYLDVGISSLTRSCLTLEALITIIGAVLQLQW